MCYALTSVEADANIELRTSIALLGCLAVPDAGGLCVIL
jgi:hypothetical protein